MDEPRETKPLDQEPLPEPVSYLRFLERWDATASAAAARADDALAAAEPAGPQQAEAKTRRRKPRPPRVAAASDSLGPFLAPRRREATETIKTRLAPEQLYWLRLTATRAGRKLSESTIIAAGLRVIEWLSLDWRCIDSRAALAAALSEALTGGGDKGTSMAAAEREWEAIRRQLGTARPAEPASPAPASPASAAASPAPSASPAPATGEGEP